MVEEQHKNVSQISIHRMMSDQVDEVYNLGIQTPQLGTGTETPQMYSKEALQRAINDPDHILLVAVENRKVIGFSITGIDNALRDAEMHELSVAEQYRQSGIGSQLVEETLRILEETTDVNHVVGHVQVENVQMQKFLQDRNFLKGRNFTWMEIMLPRIKK